MLHFTRRNILEIRQKSNNLDWDKRPGQRWCYQYNCSFSKKVQQAKFNNFGKSELKSQQSDKITWWQNSYICELGGYGDCLAGLYDRDASISLDSIWKYELSVSHQNFLQNEDGRIQKCKDDCRQNIFIFIHMAHLFV